MGIDFSEINILKDPDLFTLRSDYNQFLLSISGPTIIDISGQDQSRTRVFTTLIHGNEPSGLIGLHRWMTSLKGNSRPVTNLRFIICSPESASHAPIFSHRFLEDGMDLNRCFGTELDYGFFERANLIAKAIKEVNPEVVIDLHNTSGFGPAFAVSTNKTELALSLTSLFCSSLILSDIRLGALMEQDFGCEIITIECGAGSDPQAHEIAYFGIEQLTQIDDISSCHFNRNVDVFLQPLRLQIKPGIELHFNDVDEGLSGLTLVNNVEQFNFGIFRKEQMLGWVDSYGLSNLQIIDQYGDDVISEYFELRDNLLISKMDLNIFMATHVKNIAKSDCLLYLIPHKNKLPVD